MRLDQENCRLDELLHAYVCSGFGICKMKLVVDLVFLSGLCNPEVKMLELHKKEICSGGLTTSEE